MATRLYAVPVELKIMALDGAPLEAVGIGVPFLLEVTVSGRDVNQKPKIAGLNSLLVQTAGSRVYMFNGETSSAYTYKVRIDKPGSYVLGPATVFINGLQEQSKAVRVIVRDRQTIDPAYAKKMHAEAYEAIVQLGVDKTHVYVGERVVATLTFLGIKEKVKLENLEEPKLVDFQLGTKTGPVIGQQVINGSEYVTMTWSWDAFAQKAGQCIIPACGADYLVESEMRDSLALFSPFFRLRTERKRTYSNACTVDVENLPAYKENIDAVGRFKRFDISINPSVAAEGEGMVLLIEIEGDGNLTQIPTLQLKNMPSALKWYDSKQYVRDTVGKYGLPVKCFEYIVQGLEQGAWEIPPQLFTYFDIEKKQYQTLETASCTVSIKPGTMMKKYHADDKKGEKINSEIVQPQDTVDLSLNTWSYWYPVAQHKTMPWSLFFILAISPLLLVFVQFIWMMLRLRAVYFRQQFIFKQVSRKIKEAKKSGVTRNLYTVFIDLFAVRLGCAPSIVTQEIIDEHLKRVGFTDEEIRAWDLFYSLMYEQAFFESDCDSACKNALFEQALEWVAKLEHIL